MKFKNLSTHIQKQINNYLKKYREFAKFDIEDIIIFNKTLTKYLNHLQKILNLFRKFNIFLKYSNIALLEQKVNSFEFITLKNKLKIIMTLLFFKILKDLKTYLEIIKYLKNYISYYI